jgi:basic amino acid/polyamine antiporter, APA family
MSLFRTKPLSKLLSQAETGGLKRTLGAPGLIALGIGAVIGAGIFVRTAAAAGEKAGSGVIFSFVIAAIGCCFAGLCYAEFAAMIPIAGSAYTYAYVTMGELIAWIIGWALILEYALGAATLSIAWSEYFNQLFPNLIPWEWRHSPLQSFQGVHGVVNGPAVVILLLLTLLLIKGTSESANVNAIIVAVKVTIVVLIIGLGWKFINPINHTPLLIPENFDAAHANFFRHGWGGVVGGAGIVFFAFIGFDAVSTAAQEAINPGRDMPIGLLGSLTVCTVLYIAFSWVLTGIAKWNDFNNPSLGGEASVAYAIKTGMPGYEWLATLVTVAILFGFSSVMLVMLLGQSRVFYTMSEDGLLPKLFCDVHPRFRTPYKCNILLFFFVGAFGAFLPESLAGDLTSIGTLFAFVLVCIGVVIMRKIQPNANRPFRTPLVPIVPALGVIVCGGMIYALDTRTQLTALGWMLIGFVIYFVYGKSHSKLKDL